VTPDIIACTVLLLKSSARLFALLMPPNSWVSTDRDQDAMVGVTEGVVFPFFFPWGRGASEVW